MKTITADSIKSETISEAVEELANRDDVRDHIRSHNLNGGDLIEAIATHIIMTDTDYELIRNPRKIGILDI